MKVPRISGLRLLRALLAGPQMRQPGSSFWIMPSREEQARNLMWLNAHGIPVTEDCSYVAPMYGQGVIEDEELLEKVRESRAAWVIVAIGGGVQERLGLFLRRNLDPVPAIVCIGAAIGFLTGGQASIPPWADRLYLGWLIRCLTKPGAFIPRYWRSRHLPWLVWKYRNAMPPLRSGESNLGKK
jgi:hypothetical protein